MRRPSYACADRDTEEDGWLSVAWSMTPDNENPEEIFFKVSSDALRFRDEAAEKYKYIWVSEFGAYKMRTGRSEEDWVIFWWSDETDLFDNKGRPFGRGQGYQWSTFTFREYEPLNGEPLRKY